MKKLIKIAVSVGVSFTLLSLLMNMVTSGLSDHDRPSVLSVLQNTLFGWLFFALAIYLVTLLIRAYRYRLLIYISGNPSPPTLKQMALVTGIRNMIVDMLPARIGELGFIGLLHKGYGIRLEHCASTLAMSIAFDLLALIAVVLLIIIKQLVGDGVQTWALGALLMACILSLVAFVGLYYFLPASISILKRKYHPQNSNSIFDKGLNFLAEFNKSLITVKKSGKIISVLLLSVVIRFLKYFSFYCLFMAVAIPSFSSLVELPAEQIISALIGGEVAASLPTPTFMSFGAYEAGGSLIFYLLNIKDQAAGLVTLLCVHIWSQLIEYALGGILLTVFIWITKEQSTRKGKPPLRVTMLLVATTVFMAGTGFLAYELRAAKKMGAMNAPQSGEVILTEGDWKLASKRALNGLDGFVVWSSNRDGNHDIFKMSLPEMDVTKVTNHPHTETYARVSPNGRRIVFSRAHHVWVSQRNSVAWDVFILDLVTGKEAKLVNNATAARWVNNHEISYLQNSTTIMTMNVETLVNKRLFEPGLNNSMAPGSLLQNPAYNQQTGEVVFTAKQKQLGMKTGHWGTAIANGNNIQGVLKGCELSYSSDNSELFQMATVGGRQGTQIVSINRKTHRMIPMVDLDGEFSHEYWPKESNDGRYMVFGASRSKSEHEHDTEDYELFIWKKGSDSSKATRLTFHTGNDNWPDVFIE